MANLIATAQIIRNLFRKADSTPSAPEATSLRQKARELMRKHDIDQHVLDRPPEGLAEPRDDIGPADNRYQSPGAFQGPPGRALPQARERHVEAERDIRAKLAEKGLSEAERRALIEQLERHLMGLPCNR